MGRYIVRRLLAAIPMLFIITFLNFSLVRLAAATPWCSWLWLGNGGPASVDETRTLLSEVQKGEGQDTDQDEEQLK